VGAELCEMRAFHSNRARSLDRPDSERSIGLDDGADGLCLFSDQHRQVFSGLLVVVVIPESRIAKAAGGRDKGSCDTPRPYRAGGSNA
jgi:hypothetical protein